MHLFKKFKFNAKLDWQGIQILNEDRVQPNTCCTPLPAPFSHPSPNPVKGIYN